MLKKTSSKLPLSDKVGKGKYDKDIIELFVGNNLDLMDFVSGPFRGKRSVFASLAFHLKLDWQDAEILRELYNILVYNKRSIRDRINKQQEELHLPAIKGKLPEIEFYSFFDENDDDKESPPYNPKDSDSKKLTDKSASIPSIPKSQKRGNLDFRVTHSDKKMKPQSDPSLELSTISSDKNRKSHQDKSSRLSNLDSDKKMASTKIKSTDISNQVIQELTESDSIDLIKIDLNRTSITDLGDNIFLNVPIRNVQSNHGKIDEIKRFIKEKCVDNEIEKEIEICRKILAATHIKYKVDTGRSSNKMKTKIDFQVSSANNAIELSTNIRATARSLIDRIKDIIK